MPHIARNRVGPSRECWRNRWISVRKTTFGKQPFRLRPSQGPWAAQRFGSDPNAPQGPTSTTVPTITTTKNASSRKLTISRGPDEEISNQQTGSTRSSNLPSQTIPNPRGNASAVTLRSGKAFSQPAPQQLARLVDANFEPDVDSQMPQQDKIVLSFPTRTISARKPKSDEELLRMFRKVEINIPVLDVIKKIPKYAKFLKEFHVHKRKKMKGSVEIGGIVSMLTKNEDFTARAQLALPKKCRDPRIFSILCTIGKCTFANVMLDLGALINVMSTSI
ncbi:hypothetical protein CR513_53314, partial [Mucuna pruriens]